MPRIPRIRLNVQYAFEFEAQLVFVLRCSSGIDEKTFQRESRESSGSLQKYVPDVRIPQHRITSLENLAVWSVSPNLLFGRKLPWYPVQNRWRDVENPVITSRIEKKHRKRVTRIRSMADLWRCVKDPKIVFLKKKSLASTVPTVNRDSPESVIRAPREKLPYSCLKAHDWNKSWNIRKNLENRYKIPSIVPRILLGWLLVKKHQKSSTGKESPAFCQPSLRSLNSIT